MSVWAYIAIALYLVGFLDEFKACLDDDDEAYVFGDRAAHTAWCFVMGAIWPVSCVINLFRDDR